MADGLMGIGELARRAALPVKTVRYYADIDLVPPAARTGAGYRRYGDAERVRLETVKTLRGLGFGLREIALAVEQRTDLRDVIEVQLHAVQARLHELQRTAVVLRAALDRADEPTAVHLARLETLARMTADERTALVDEFLTGVQADAPVDEGWWAGLRTVSLPDLPDEPTADQLDAWLELAQLLSDEEYREDLRRRTAGSWTEDAGARQRELSPVLMDALLAVGGGAAPDGAQIDALVDRFVQALGDGDRTPDQVLADIDRADDPRSRRYWDLVARIHEWTTDRSSGDAFDWLTAALRRRVG